jgi:D-arabinose 1-dehydrogenase-like Zn-dependent alcohol dehydrogenase
VLAKELGTNIHIDNKSTNPAEALQRLGGAKVILATAPNAKAMSELVDGLRSNGKLILESVTFDPMDVTPVQSSLETRRIKAGAAGTPADFEDTLRFADLSGVRPMFETCPLERTAETNARIMSGKAQFRVALRM